MHQIIIIATIIATGIWFLRRQETTPKIEISHGVEQRRINETVQLMSIDITITNKGVVPVRMGSSLLRLQQILPLGEDIGERLNNGYDLILAGERTADWPAIAESRTTDTLTVLPGEKRVVCWELGVDTNVKTVRIYTFFSSSRTGKTGWAYSSICDIKEQECTKP